MYGEGMFYIKDIDISNNKLRLTVANEFEDEHYIYMNPANAQELVNKIWMTVEDYQNKIRQGIG